MKNKKLNMWTLPEHLPVLLMFLGVGCVFIGLMTLFLGKTPVGVILLDSKTQLFPYP